MMSPSEDSSAGFSVVELIATLVIAALAVILVSNMYATAGRLFDRTDDLMVANSLAYNKLEKYEGYRFEDIPFRTDGQPQETFDSEVPTSLPGPREGKVYITEQTSTMKYIFVRVKYGVGADEKVVEYGSLVQAGGIGR